MAFQKLRGGVQANAVAATEVALEKAESTLRSVLNASALFGNVEVGTTDDPDRLLIAMVNYLPGTPESEVEAYLAGIWAGQVRDLGWDAAAFLVDTDHVEMQAATLNVGKSRYVTLHLVATPAVFAREEAPARVAPRSHRAPRRGIRRLVGA